jgi:peroxidase
MSQNAAVSLAAYKKIVKGEKATKLNYKTTRFQVPYPYCQNASSIVCDACSAIFRTSDGSCNNPSSTWWGKSETPDKRLLPAVYDDYASDPRVRSVQPGKFLPNARKVASTLFQPQDSVSEWSQFMTYFGQYVDHDATLTAQSIYADGFRKLCPCNSYDPDCLSIPIPYDDYANNDQTCMSFVRSLPSVNVFNCFLAPREQLNVQTSWLDLSQLYGYYPELALKLRDRANGTLKSSWLNGKEYLPYASNTSYTANRYASEYSRRQKCFLNGDPRTEDNVVLTSIQTLFLREHNRLARLLQKQNPTWSDEMLYQTAKKIVIAEYNNIIYNEYLPALLGTDVTGRLGLDPQSIDNDKDPFFRGYNQKIYPQVINEFATAAFRYGHTQLAYSAYTASRLYKKSDEPKPISQYLFNNQFYQTSMDDIIRGALVDYSYAANAQVNSYFEDWLFNGIFYRDSKRWSLPALNIQRGRDHGLPGYNLYREKCGLNRASKFEDFKNIPENIVKKWKTLYASPDDVDLFAGLFSELPMENALVGPTAGCKLDLKNNLIIYKSRQVGKSFYPGYVLQESQNSSFLSLPNTQPNLHPTNSTKLGNPTPTHTEKTHYFASMSNCHSSANSVLSNLLNVASPF